MTTMVNYDVQTPQTINVDVTPPAPIVIDVTPPKTIAVTVTPAGVGPQGPIGPMGPSGTMVVAVPFDEWPPADPQPNTLYLRLAP